MLTYNNLYLYKCDFMEKYKEIQARVVAQQVKVPQPSLKT